jgi:hypothetical protein
LRPCCNRLVGQKMSCKFLIASTYDYIRNTCLWLLVLGCFIIIYLQCPCLTDFMNYLIHATLVHPSLCLQSFILLFTIATITAFILLPLLLFYYYHHYKTVATDKPLRTCLFPGAAELTTHLLRLINILWLPLCWINKFGFYFPRRLLRSPILVGHQPPRKLRWSPKSAASHRPLPHHRRSPKPRRCPSSGPHLTGDDLKP